MKVIVTLESNRVMVSNLDLDKNPFLYELKSTREPNYTVLSSQLHVHSLNAYLGDMVQLIRYERPGINIATNIFNHLNDPDYTYVEHNGRKWNATLLTAIIVKRLISKIEESVTTRIKEMSFVLSPSIQKSQTARELKTALGYHKLEMGGLYSHSSAILAYYDHRKPFKEEVVVVIYADAHNHYVQVLRVAELRATILGAHQGNLVCVSAILHDILEVVLRQCIDAIGSEPSTSEKNDLVLDNVVLDVYRSFFVKQKKELVKPIFLDSKPCLLRLQAADFEAIATKYKDQVSINIVKCLDEALVSYQDVDHIYTAGEFACSHLIAHTVSGLFDGWDGKYRFDDQAIAKGAARLLYAAEDSYQIVSPPKKVVTDDGVVSIIQLMVEDGEEYVVFDKDALSNYTTITVNLAAYESILDESDEILFAHYIEEQGQRRKVGEIAILHDVDIYPAQMQLNIIRKGEQYRSIQAIDFENDQILNVEYRSVAQLRQEEQALATDTAQPGIIVQAATSDQRPQKSSGSIKIQSRSKIKIKVNAASSNDTAVAVAEPPSSIDTGTKAKIQIKKSLDKKIKIEIKSEEIKDKFEEILDIIMINNSK